MKRFEPDEKLGIYTVIRHLQSGGMGDIYEVYNTQLERPEAMKVLPPELAEQPDFVARFIGEARKNARLDHPNIVPVYQISETGMRPVYFTMKLIYGQTLKQWFKSRLPLPERQAIELLLQINEALIYAHSQGLIHRDLKPANLMFDAADRLYLMDFGIARAAQDTHLTHTGTQMGTAAYMSPEQAQDAKHVDARSDLYSLGVMLFEMLTGRTPFLSDSHVGMALKHIQEPIPDPKFLNPGLSEGMVNLIRHLLEKDPELRVSSALELRDRLRMLLNPLQTSAQTPESQTEIQTAVSGAEASAPFDPFSLLEADSSDQGTLAFGTNVLNDPKDPDRTAPMPPISSVLTPTADPESPTIQPVLPGQSLPPQPPPEPQPAPGVTLPGPILHQAKPLLPVKAPKSRKLLLVGGFVLAMFLGAVLYAADQEGYFEEDSYSNDLDPYLNSQSMPNAMPTMPADLPGDLASEPPADHLMPNDDPIGRFPFTEQRPIVREDLIKVSCKDLELMRNEIFARYGRKFENPALKAHFEAQDWYEPDPNYTDDVLSELERYNAGFILGFEQATQCM